MILGIILVVALGGATIAFIIGLAIIVQRRLNR